jgi:metal-sulfur cluster biosynthetic enzyme/nitrite reductase/ring-hydroxylating ferredoxin subunit
MPRFVPVAKVSEIPQGDKRVVECDERFIVVCHVEGKFYAIDDTCTHDDGPLGEGPLVGYEIACPRHGARFDVRNGRALSMPATHDTGSYPVRIEGDDVLIGLPGDEEQATGGAGTLSEDVAREALKQVIDPELFVNIVDLGLIYLVQVTEAEGKSNVLVEMTMTSPACPAGPQLLQNSKDALQRLPGVATVEVKLVMTPPWTPDRMTEDARDQLGIF